MWENVYEGARTKKETTNPSIIQSNVLQMASIVGNSTALSLVIQRSGRKPEGELAGTLKLLDETLEYVGVKEAREQLIKRGDISPEDWSVNDTVTEELLKRIESQINPRLNDARRVKFYCKPWFLRRHLIGLWTSSEEPMPDVITADALFDAYMAWDPLESYVDYQGYRLVLDNDFKFTHLGNTPRRP